MPMMRHPVPAQARRRRWAGCTSSAAPRSRFFMIQILTGIGLALVYVPAADKAYESLLYLDYEQPLGWFLRALHYYAGSGMVVMLLVHMTQVFLHGSYKYPRELTWVVGVFLLALHDGHVLHRPDSPLGPRCLLGPRRRRLDGRAACRCSGRGSSTCCSAARSSAAIRSAASSRCTCSSFPARCWCSSRCICGSCSGAASAPRRCPARSSIPQTYDADYHEELEDEGVPFLGDAMLKDILFSALAVICRRRRSPPYLGPKGPTGPPDPALADANPRPEWPFLWLFGLLSLSPPAIETFIMLVFPVVVIVVLLLVPFVSNRGERAPSRRPVAVLLGDRHLHDARRAHLRGRHRALVAEDERLERRPDPRANGRATPRPSSCRARSSSSTRTAATATRSTASAATAAPISRTIGVQHDARSAHRSGQQRHARRRQHARLRQADQPGRDGRARRFPGEPPPRGPAPRRDADDARPSKARRRSRSN